MDILHSLTKQFRSTKPKKKIEGAEVFIAEVLHTREPRNNFEEASEAKRKELKALVKRGTWKVIFQRSTTGCKHH